MPHIDLEDNSPERQGQYRTYIKNINSGKQRQTVGTWNGEQFTDLGTPLTDNEILYGWSTV